LFSQHHVQPQEIAVAKRHVHSFSEQFAISGIEKHLRTKKEIRLKMGDTDILQVMQLER